MSDRDILERAAVICFDDGLPNVAEILKGIADRFAALEPDPPQPAGKVVRIAVAHSSSGHTYCESIDDAPEDIAWDEIRAMVDDAAITHKAVGVLVIPPVAVPVVEGRVEL